MKLVQEKCIDMIKPNLEAFNDRADLVFVVNRFNYIEQIVNKIIANYINASENRRVFVESILLNNSIVSFGSKIKLFLHMNATESWGNIKKDDFHRLAHIRNQFAHSGKQTFRISLGTSEENSFDIRLMLESLGGNGKLIEVKAEDALQEFTEIFAKLKDQLHTVLERQKNYCNDTES